ncbi:M13 family metallopeptidase [Aggregicoccus sp. 17bor-14]|uniref:M13 family metallopeptidase n=1 Tax=Myxococcaceae TaxID=31 RepID=UPI00129D1B26|nr:MULTISPECIES: M13 family metallopeptidase [Myxococcaceae]MBF5042237.1 M13 family metallopeptidase [Simulacricoccus sp. 17bor-14]MRI88012.1 M13 family metallopeptidase [Aggregicoccus sp. 17bor-14]
MILRKNPLATAALRALLAGSATALVAACASSAPAEKASADKASAATASTAPAAAPATPAPPPPAASPKPTYGTFGVDTAGMDRSVPPGDSFYKFVNGTWDKNTEIPADRSSYGMFTKLADDAAKVNRALIEGAAKADAPEGSETRKIGDYFNTYMDEQGIEQQGTKPLQPELARIQGLKDRKALSQYLGDTLRADVDALNTGDVNTERLMGVWVTLDLNDPSRYAPVLMQGGLMLPDRSYYLENNPKFQEVRQQYVQHVAKMLGLAGVKNPEAAAKRVMALETKIARVHWKQEDTQDVAHTNNPWKRSEFARRAPGLDWNAYLTAGGLGDQQHFIVWQPSAITGLAKLVGAEPMQSWKDYLAYHAVERAAAVMPKAFVDESFAFFGQTLSGAKEQRARWKRGVDLTNEALGEAIGKLYVQKYFPPEAKAQADAMVKNVIAALAARIDGLEWMTPETKVKAKEKLTTLKVGIGHPDKWIDYSSLEVKPGDAYGNLERYSRFETKRQLAKLGQPIDRSEWFMVPQEVNALNAPQLNAIIFPAAILQPPFFDPNADPAVNYGGIGTVIGHEIVHSFDDTGAQFDAQGKLANWWTKEDGEKFKAAGKELADQYSSYHPLPDLAINGNLTLGENIADLGGIAASFGGYHMSLGGKEAPVLDGFTGDQRFFLGFAQVWRTKYREPLLRRLLLTDGHSPGEQRASTVRNVDAWYKAFDVKPGTALYLTPEQRVHMW